MSFIYSLIYQYIRTVQESYMFSQKCLYIYRLFSSCMNKWLRVIKIDLSKAYGLKICKDGIRHIIYLNYYLSKRFDFFSISFCHSEVISKRHIPVLQKSAVTRNLLIFFSNFYMTYVLSTYWQKSLTSIRFELWKASYSDLWPAC